MMRVFRRMRRGRGGWLLMSLLLVTACAPLPTKEIAVTQAVDCDAAWRLRGRIALRRGSESETIMLEWQHRAAQEKLKFSGLLGQGILSLTVTGQHVVVDRGDGKLEFSDAADQWLQAHFGFDLPVAALRYWACGLPYPRWSHRVVDQGFVQNDWLVTYAKFNEREGWRWPGLIAAMQPGLSVKLAIDDWMVDHEQ